MSINWQYKVSTLAVIAAASINQAHADDHKKYLSTDISGAILGLTCDRVSEWQFRRNQEDLYVKWFVASIENIVEAYGGDYKTADFSALNDQTLEEAIRVAPSLDFAIGLLVSEANREINIFIDSLEASMRNQFTEHSRLIGWIGFTTSPYEGFGCDDLNQKIISWDFSRPTR